MNPQERIMDIMTKKTITVFGANGNVGRLIVTYALSEGYTVRAFVHDHNDLPDHAQLHIIKGDVRNPDDIAAAINGADAVLSALSSWKAPEKNVLSSAMEQLIPAMKTQHINRIISLTGAEARANGDELSIIHRIAHAVLGIVGGNVIRDGEKHLSLLEHSGLDWVVLRSPVMKSTVGEVYSLSDKRPLPWSTVSRHAVARAMINQINIDPLSQQAPYIR